jgi:hypothetical protein
MEWWGDDPVVFLTINIWYVIHTTIIPQSDGGVVTLGPPPAPSAARRETSILKVTQPHMEWSVISSNKSKQQH